MTKNAIWAGQIWHRTGKTGQEISIPIHPDLARLLREATAHNAPEITSRAAILDPFWTRPAQIQLSA